MFIYTTNALRGEARYYQGSKRMPPPPPHSPLPTGYTKFNDYTHAMYMYVAVTGVAAVALFFFKADYRRLEVRWHARLTNGLS